MEGGDGVLNRPRPLPVMGCFDFGAHREVTLVLCLSMSLGAKFSFCEEFNCTSNLDHPTLTTIIYTS